MERWILILVVLAFLGVLVTMIISVYNGINNILKKLNQVSDKMFKATNALNYVADELRWAAEDLRNATAVLDEVADVLGDSIYAEPSEEDGDKEPSYKARDVDHWPSTVFDDETPDRDSSEGADE